MAEELGLGVLPWSPLANGLLSGKYTRENPSPAGAGRGMFVGHHLNERTWQVVDSLVRIADERGRRSRWPGYGVRAA